MRIIAGIHKGRKIIAPRSPEIRPTSDRVREALFSTLEARFSLEGALVLDLFAGTGAVGIEALSRGAEYACFIDKSRDAIAAITKNVADIGVSVAADIIFLDILSLGFPSKARSIVPRKPFNIIFADPPYGLVSLSELLTITVDASLAQPGSVFVFEDRTPFQVNNNSSTPFHVVVEKKLGDTCLTILEMD